MPSNSCYWIRQGLLLQVAISFIEHRCQARAEGVIPCQSGNGLRQSGCPASRQRFWVRIDPLALGVLDEQPGGKLQNCRPTLAKAVQPRRGSAANC